MHYTLQMSHIQAFVHTRTHTRARTRAHTHTRARAPQLSHSLCTGCPRQPPGSAGLLPEVQRVQGQRVLHHGGELWRCLRAHPQFSGRGWQQLQLPGKATKTCEQRCWFFVKKIKNKIKTEMTASVHENKLKQEVKNERFLTSSRQNTVLRVFLHVVLSSRY